MPQRSELADLLRIWRERISPAAVGLTTGRRRTQGLRREEVALLAGISVDYLVRIEQGRGERPSEQVIASLARVLQISALERDQLYLAAGLPTPSLAHVRTYIPASVQRLLARLPEVAIGVYTCHWNLLTVNSAWTALLGTPGRDVNLIAQQFTGTAPTVQQEPEVTELFERALVSDLRTAVIRYPEDRDVRALVARLTETSVRFAELWRTGSIVEHQSRPKTFLHPQVGLVTLDCDVFTAVGTDLRIVTYTAVPDSEDASRYDLARTLGAAHAAR